MLVLSMLLRSRIFADVKRFGWAGQNSAKKGFTVGILHSIWGATTIETVAEVPVSASVRSGIDNSAVIIYDHGDCHALSMRRSLMSLHPQVFYLVPEETARIARAANPKGNVYLQMYDTFGTIFAHHQFASLFPVHGQPAEAPVRLALISMLQFAEGLTDRQAADAVRTRLDWK